MGNWKKDLLVETMSTGEIRVSTELAPEEAKHGTLVRGFSDTEALDLAARLVEAAKAVRESETRMTHG